MKVFISRFVLFILVILVLTGELIAQPNCKIEHYSTENGLSHDIITCIFKDKEGFMWFGTWNGLNRFDGHKFRSFKSVPGDRSQLKNDRIDQIAEDNANHLWIKAYDGQVYRFDKGSEQFLTLSSIIGSKERTAILYRRIVAADENTLWLTTFNSGLIFIPDTRAVHCSYVTYKVGNPAKYRLPSNEVNFFQKDRKGDVWIGTASGLVHLVKNSKGRYDLQPLSLKNNDHFNFTGIAETQHHVFFLTTDGHVVIYDQMLRSFAMITVSLGKLNAIVSSKNEQFIYITTSKGVLAAINTANFHVNVFTYQGKNPLYSIYEDHTGNLWLEPEEQGVIRFDPVTAVFKTYLQENDGKFNYGGSHYKVFEDNLGNVWAIMKGGGFGYYDKQTDQVAYFYHKPNSVDDHQLSNIVFAAYYDADGILWLHTDLRGIEKVIFQPNEFTQHLLINSWRFKSDNEVRGLLHDRKDRLWVATKNGKIYMFASDGRVKSLVINPGKGGFGSIYTMMQDSKGSIWLGTKANGLFRADPVNLEETVYKVSHFQSIQNDAKTLSSNEIYAIREDHQGRIWVGTYDGGLNLIVPKEDDVEIFRIKDSPSGSTFQQFNKIRCLAIDHRGIVWVGTTNGLIVIDANQNQLKVHTYTKIPGDMSSLGNNDIQYIFCDSSNRIWLATSGGGLNLAEREKLSGRLSFRVYTTRDGLPNDYILSCTEDKEHCLWLATQGGVSRYNQRTGRFQSYDSNDGVPNAAFSEATCQRMNDGTIVFGTIRGYLSFHPEEIRDYPIISQMAFTNLQINNLDMNAGTSNSVQEDVNKTSEVVLDYHQNIFSIDYTVLDYRATEKPTYMYRLAGFDTLWHNNQNQRRATFTNLPPGDYLFEVKCINPDLYKNTPYKKLKITILPPPWKTGWAYFCYIVATFAILLLIRRTVLTMLGLRQRIAVEQELAELKMNFFTNVSHELRTPLTLILNPLEEIAKNDQLSPQQKRYIKVVQRNANRMARFINQLLDLRKVQSGRAELNYSQVDLIPFIKEICKNFNELGSEKKIKLTIIHDSEGVFGWMDAEKIETVLYNMIGNAYKFTPAGKELKISVTSEKESEYITIEVIDQGKGVTDNELKEIFKLYFTGNQGQGSPSKGTGIGLALSKELIELHHGHISAKNNIAGGLSVTIDIPMVKIRPEHSSLPVMEASVYPTRAEEFAILQTIQETAETEPGNAPLVLLVEDNMDMRAFLTEQLSSTYRVEAAENGEEGLRKARKLIPDLILSDIMMPKMNGIQLLDTLKNDTLTSHIPIILLSAKCTIQSQIEGINYGADYYITKPFNNDFMLAAVANILAQRKKLLDGLISGKRIVDLSPGEIVISSADEAFLKKVISIVEEKISDPDFNIVTAAAMVNMARTTFFNKFKGLTQIPPVEFVRNMRLKRAKQYFDAGTTNIALVADQVGFINSKYFSTCFKMKYELSPSDYIKTIEMKNNKVDIS